MKEEWYELIRGDENRVETPLMAIEEELFGFDYELLKLGDYVEGWDTKSSIRSDSVEHDGTPDDLLCNSLGLPIVSARLRQALADARVGQKDLQYLPIQVLDSTGRHFPGFSIANVVSRVSALNWEHSEMLDTDESEIDPLTGKPSVLGVWRAALNDEAIVGHDVIRLVEFFAPIFVSARFAQLFRVGEFTGATLMSVPVY